MLLNTYESEFLTELSDDQQEQVSGGAFGLSTTDFNLAQFAKVSKIATASASGPAGSIATGVAVEQIAAMKLNTSGTNVIAI